MSFVVYRKFHQSPWLATWGLDHASNTYTTTWTTDFDRGYRFTARRDAEQLKVPNAVILEERDQ